MNELVRLKTEEPAEIKKVLFYAMELTGFNPKNIDETSTPYSSCGSVISI